MLNTLNLAFHELLIGISVKGSWMIASHSKSGLSMDLLEKNHNTLTYPHVSQSISSISGNNHNNIVLPHSKIRPGVRKGHQCQSRPFNSGIMVGESSNFQS